MLNATELGIYGSEFSQFAHVTAVMGSGSVFRIARHSGLILVLIARRIPGSPARTV
jgi:hypothetical protein